MSDDLPALAWHAISAAMARLYPGQTPYHFTVAHGEAADSSYALDGVSAYAAELPRPHWHFVSYGFSDLFGEQEEDGETSGFGFELTLRLARPAAETRPPKWPALLLENLAQYVFQSGRGFAARHVVSLNGPLAEGIETQLVSAAFVVDPQLGGIETASGQVTFLQLVPLSHDEHAAANEWCTEGLLEFLIRKYPLYIVDFERPSLLADPRMAEEFERRSSAEGSSQDLLFVSFARWQKEQDTMHLSLGANAVGDLRRVLRGRLGHGRSFLLSGREASIAWEPAESDGWRIKDELLVVSLSALTMNAVRATLEERRGIYRWPTLRNFELEIVPSPVRDKAGNVVRVIG